MEVGLSEAQLGREYKDLLRKFHSYLICNKDGEIAQIFKDFS